MQRGHSAGLDAPGKARSQNELRAAPELFQKRPDLSKIVGEIGVAHQHVLAPDEGDCVQVGPAQTPPRSLQHARAGGQGLHGCGIGRAVDNQDLAPHTGVLQPFVAPGDKLGDGLLFIERGDDDRDLRLRGVAIGDKQANFTRSADERQHAFRAGREIEIRRGDRWWLDAAHDLKSSNEMLTLAAGHS